jgi:molybdate transport system ATP-binding protein
MLAIDIRVQRARFSLDAKLAIPTPGVTALFGPSGAGKTTLAHAVAGLVPTSGTISLDGETLLDTTRGICLPPEQRAVGCVFQDARLFPHLSVAGNLDFGLKRQRRAVYAQRAEVIELLGLSSLLRRSPHQLSGGERQRVALGRALLGQPRLLVLDEPLAAIDTARREEVLPYLEVLRDRFRIPMLYVSHQYEEVLRLAAQVVLVDQGQIVATDTPAALSLSTALRSRVGTGGVGTVIETEVVAKDAADGLITVMLGGHPLRLNANVDAIGTHLRLRVLASDVILATECPNGLSVRNALPGRIERLEAEDHGWFLATVLIGQDRILARITRSAIDDLALTPGLKVWALVKAASLNQGLYRTSAAAPSVLD